MKRFGRKKVILGIWILAISVTFEWGASLSQADLSDGNHGVACLKSYADYIHKDLSGLNSEVSSATQDVQKRFEKDQKPSISQSALRMLVAGLPFGIAIIDNASIIIDVFKILKTSIGYLRGEIRAHRFGKTFELSH